MDTRVASYPAGNLRVSDADRDKAIAELSEHFQAGRLTLDEFEERSGRALNAKTAGDLRGLFTDLPGQGTSVLPPPRGPEPMLAPGGPLAGGRMLIGLPIALFVAAGLLSGPGHHPVFGALVPIAIVYLVVMRTRSLRRAGRM